MQLDTKNWKFFHLRDLCEIDMGSKLDFSAMSSDNPTINFVGRSADNNGVMGVVDEIEGKTIYPTGSITVALGGSLGSTFVQAAPFYTSQNVSVLQFRDKQVTLEAKLFLATMIHHESKFKYFPFGRELNKYIRTVYGFNLPIQRNQNDEPILNTSKGYHPDGYMPDWEFMTNFIRKLNHKPITTVNEPRNTATTFELENWQWFQLGGKAGLFDIKKGKRLTTEDQTEGSTRYIGAIDSNNGVANRIGQRPIHSSNTISLSYNGSVGEAFYQPEPYWATDDVNALYLRPEYGEMNAARALFICAILRQEKYRYSYGRKWTTENMRATRILLPTTPGGRPDWEYMENYIRTLPYGDRILSTSESV